MSRHQYRWLPSGWRCFFVLFFWVFLRSASYTLWIWFLIWSFSLPLKFLSISAVSVAVHTCPTIGALLVLLCQAYDHHSSFLYSMGHGFQDRTSCNTHKNMDMLSQDDRLNSCCDMLGYLRISYSFMQFFRNMLHFSWGLWLLMSDLAVPCVTDGLHAEFQWFTMLYILIYQGVHCCTKVCNLHLDDSPSKSRDNRMHWTQWNLLEWKGIYKNCEPFTDQLQPIYFSYNGLQTKPIGFKYKLSKVWRIMLCNTMKA